MSRSRTRSSKKKTVTIAVLVACLLLAAIGGTIAWMTAQDSLTNQFAVGDFDDPTTEPGNPEKPIDPDNPDNPKDPNLSGHLYEPNWVAENNKITPGTTLTKDPYVGIGDGSENAIVYVYIRNSAKNPQNIYFKLNEGWEAVEGYADVATSLADDATNPGYKNDAKATYYTGGLFKYKNVLVASENKDEWTGNPVFSNVYVRNSADNEDLMPEEGSSITALKVTALLHQARSGNAEATDLEEIADEWAKDQVDRTLKTEDLNETP